MEEIQCPAMHHGRRLLVGKATLEWRRHRPVPIKPIVVSFPIREGNCMVYNDLKDAFFRSPFTSHQRSFRFSMVGHDISVSPPLLWTSHCPLGISRVSAAIMVSAHSKRLTPS